MNMKPQRRPDGEDQDQGYWWAKLDGRWQIVRVYYAPDGVYRIGDELDLSVDDFDDWEELSEDEPSR